MKLKNLLLICLLLFALLPSNVSSRGGGGSGGNGGGKGRNSSNIGKMDKQQCREWMKKQKLKKLEELNSNKGSKFFTNVINSKYNPTKAEGKYTKYGMYIGYGPIVYFRYDADTGKLF